MSRRWLAAALIGLLAAGCGAQPASSSAGDAAEAYLPQGWPEIVEVGVGMDYSCARDASGAVYCWGGSGRGQLGVGRREPQARPVRVHGVDDARDLSVGFGHACVVRRGGGVACWGMNVSAELGDGTTDDQPLPVEVLDLDDAVEVAAGMGFTCALRRGGTVVCWGRDIGRSPVDPGPERLPTPQPVEGLEEVMSIDAGSLHACALRRDGRALCWGTSLSHAVGPESFGSVRAPAALPFDGVRQIAAGHEHSCVLLDGGEVRCWGGGRLGQLGGSGSDRGVPAAWAVPIDGLGSVLSLDAGERSTCVVLRGGEVRCWGGDQGTPRRVAGLGPAVQIAVSRALAGAHSCALSASSEIWCWGQNEQGQLGDGTRSGSDGPVRVMAPLSTAPVAIEVRSPEGPPFVADEVAAGYDQTCARRGAEVWCWGRPPGAKLNPAPPDWTRPRRLEGIDGASKLAAGFGFMCALLGDGTVSCWGENSEGQLGDGTTEWRAAPTAVLGIDDAVDLVADLGLACAIRSGGEVWCWGGSAPRAAPLEDLRPYGGRIQQLALCGHRCLLLRSGEVLCQGHNGFGQIGNGEGGCWPDPEDLRCSRPGAGCRPRQICAKAESLVPVRDLGPAVQLALGGGFSCARHRDGGVSCWGKNHQGQLGRGTRGSGEETWLPAPVVGLADAVDIRAEADRVCARRASGSAVCWGQNVFGELGDRTTQDRYAPTAVYSPAPPSRTLEPIVELSLGHDHSCARTEDDRIWCWGDNTHGQLGDGTTLRRLAPGLVRGGGS